jgi:hypothetical protein
MVNNHQTKNQVFLQIILPMVFFILVIGATSFFLFSNLSSGKMDYRIWSDISILIIFIPLILSFVFTLLFTALLIFLISIFQSKLINALKKANSFIKTFSFWTIKLANLILQPVIRIESFFTQIFSLLKN